MKRIALGCLLLLGVMPIVLGFASAGCDQNFYKTLRYNKQYTFSDEFNANSSDKWIWNWDMDYSEQYDYNQSSDFPQFDWTQDIINSDYKVAKGTTKSVIKAKSPYPILAVPTSRSYDNLLLTYTIKYSTDEAGNNMYTHTECGHYEISWCGDGVVDSSYGEVCDPKDSNKTGWGNGGCNSSCQPVTVAAPVCNSSYHGQKLTSLVEGSHLCTEGTYSDFGFSDSTHKWTWKCGNTAGTKVDCWAIKPYCGDGVVDAGEACDPEASEWKNRTDGKTCSSTCTVIEPSAPVCNSSYHGQRLTSLVEGSHLCTEGTYSNFEYSDSTHKWTWKCGNAAGTKVDCWATKPYCGDGVKDAGETCDPKDSNKTGWGNGGCDASCNPITVAGPSCNSSYHGQRLTSLTEGNHLCTEGTYSDFGFSDSTHKWTWKCGNSLGTKVDCWATKPYCGDGVKDAGETCDPADTSHAGRSDLGCDASCNPIQPSGGCDETFYDKLRFGRQYTFYDDYNAGSSDKWLRNWTMEYTEQYDYNKSSSFPSFAWTTNLVNNNYKVPANTSMRVLQATSTYPILAVPAQRAYDNLFIKYTITSSTDSAGTNKHAHSECAYYEISRCGDGILDTDYDETCDPKDPNKTGWGNGGCDAECKPVTVANGTPKIEKTLKDKKQVKEIGEVLTWEVKVWAEGGDVTDFQIEDIVPAALKYKSYTVKSNSDNLTVNNPTGPVMSGEDSVYTWNVKGTLKKDHQLIIEVTTEVVKMPKSNDDYRNVACVIKDNNKDCDDDKPDPTNGTPKIEKTLEGKRKVESTGEILTWEVKVWAEGGDVTDFQIEDIVPAALKYKSYKVKTNPDNLTVNNPTGPVMSGEDSVYTRDVKGTLKEAHQLIIEVTTEVVKMPKSNDDYRNVACVIKDNKKDCDDDKPDPSKGYLVPDKTLIGSKEIKNTGDVVKWSLKVTAKGGDVTDVVITDKLPPVLAYNGFEVKHSGGLDISNYPTSSTFQSGGETWTKIVWNAKGTLKENDYVEIILTTYAKEMPSKDYNNVLCVRPEGVDPNDEDCDDEPVPSPDPRIKKTFTDGSKIKVVAIGDEIGYKITFGNKGTASATITSIKDFLPKNVKYVSSKIFMVAGVNSQDSSDGTSIDIYGGITLEPNAEGYIILTGKILSEFTGSTQNLACIYLNDEKIECDDAIHTFTDKLMCTKPDITTTSFTKEGGSTDVVCKTFPTGEKADSIELDCGNGTIFTGSNIDSLKGTCTYPANNSSSSVSYTVECKVNNVDENDCKGTVTVPGTTPPGTCFIAGTKVLMADGSEKNIEDVKVGEKIMGENGFNTVLGYDRPVLGERHLWSINGGEYFVSDEHPFKTTQGWKSFNPEMTKLEIDLNTTELVVGDTLITKNGLEIVETVAYKNADYSTTLYNFVLDGDHTYYANGYLVHNKGGEDPYCKAPVKDGSTFTCESTDKVYAIGIDCDHVVGKVDIDKEKTTGDGSRDILSVSASCNQDAKVQCYVKKNSSSSWETKTSGCGWEPSSPGSSCFVAGTKVTMADGSKKNIEDVKIGDKVLGSNGTINTVLGYDRPALGNRHLWSINGGEYFVSDEHPFKTTQGWKSFNPEMTKLEIDLNTTKLNLGDKIITENGEEEIKTANYITKDADTQLYNFVLDGDHTYHANGYLVHNKGGGSCFVAGTKVTMADGSEKNIEDVKIGDEILGEGGANVVLGYDRPILRSRHLWSINGGEYFVSDEHPFKTTQGWKSFNPEMTKLEIDLNTTELKVGDVLITTNGLEEVKTIEYIEADYNTQLYNFVLGGDHTYYANGYLVHNKGTDPDPVLYDSAACFNVNTNNVSIEQGEILPFFWNISNLENNKDIFVVLGDGDYGDDVFEVQKDIISKYQNEECEDEGVIALNSMLCDFKIRDGNSKVVYEGQFPCLRDTKGKGKSWVSDKGLLDAWMKYGKNKYSGDGKYKFFWSFSNSDRSYALRSNLNYIPEFGLKDKNGNTINTFGEYKLSLTKIEYLQCRNEKWTFWAPEITTCENNFALTNSYTVQKTPSGNLKASTTELDKYLYMNGNTALKASDLLRATIATSDYAQNDAVNKAMNNFVNKYQKLAVSVDGGMKKVPGKSIYFVEGDKVIKDGAFTKPTTFVQMDPSKKITIEGNVENLNIMVLTRGTIVFKDTNDCNPVKAQSRQTVKGIFYGENGLRREGVLKNTDINASRRCTEGGLTIKGVLIGKGFDGLMKDSRSNLNNWFGSSQKKNIVMNGASVLIEYSPSVFTKSSMPPGAEDFTTALSIYKN